MAQKKIIDLQLRSSFEGSVSIPVDDTSQTWRVTGAQIKSYIGDELVPATTKGDIITRTSSAAARLPVGANGTVLVADSTQTTGLGWGSVTQSSYDAINLGLSTSVGANALTITLKQADGTTDPATANGAVSLGFRSATATTGSITRRSVTGSLSLTIPSGTTIGTESAIASDLFVYAIDNAGTVELAVSMLQVSERIARNTSAISGGTSPTTIYSATARTGVAIRLIGKIRITQATAGTWASAATSVEISNSNGEPFITEWRPYTVTIAGTSGAPTKGTTTFDQGAWKRVGDTMHMKWCYSQTSGGASGSGTNYLFSPPTGYTVDTTKWATSTTSAFSNNIGHGLLSTGGNYFLSAAMNTSNTWWFYILNPGGGPTIWGSGDGAFSGTVYVSFNVIVPITEFAI